MYQNLSSVKVETGRKSVNEIVAEILRIVA